MAKSSTPKNPLRSTIKFRVMFSSIASIRAYYPMLINAICEKLSNFFGEATIGPIYWTRTNANIVRLNIVVWAYCTTKQLEDHFLALKAFIDEISSVIGADNFTVEVNGSTYFLHG